MSCLQLGCSNSVRSGIGIGSCEVGFYEGEPRAMERHAALGPAAFWERAAWGPVLMRFLADKARPSWVSGPLRAAQFLHTLNDPEPVRRELLARGYPVPRRTIDLALMRRARQEWKGANSSVALN
jgi:hypothetical protein